MGDRGHRRLDQASLVGHDLRDGLACDATVLEGGISEAIEFKVAVAQVDRFAEAVEQRDDRALGGVCPEIARQMHYDEVERRSIYGEAKPDEVKELVEEGVEVQPLPVLPEDRN